MLDGPEPDAFSRGYWPDVVDNAKLYTKGMGINPGSLGDPIDREIYACEVDGNFDWETPKKLQRVEVRERLVGFRALLTGGDGLMVPDEKTYSYFAAQPRL